jgi:hypothetical protein
MAGACHLPVAILTTGFDLRPDRASEIAGFFYFGGAVPKDVDARRLFQSDFLMGRSCQVFVRGTPPQVEELLRVAAVSSGWSLQNSLGIAECIRVSLEARMPFTLDNLEDATGRGLAIEGPISLVEDEGEIAHRLVHLADALELNLAPDWLPSDSWLSY